MFQFFLLFPENKVIKIEKLFDRDKYSVNKIEFDDNDMVDISTFFPKKIEKNRKSQK